MDIKNKVIESPAWAANILRGAALLAFLSLLAAIVPSWRPRSIHALGLAFGVFWCLFGLSTFAFDWAIPRRGGGFISPDHSRWLWLAISLGTALLGATTLVMSARSLWIPR